MTNLLNLPIELVKDVLLACVRARTLKRAMRLRLVSRLFRCVVDEIIIKSDVCRTQIRRILPKALRDASRRGRQWHVFVHAYVQHNVESCSDGTSAWGRLGHVARRLCKLCQDVGDERPLSSCIDAVVATLQHAGRDQPWGISDLGKNGAIHHFEDQLEDREDMKARLLYAAVSLNHPTLVRRLLLDRPVLEHWSRWSPTVPGDMNRLLGLLIEQAASLGNIMTMRTLLEAEQAHRRQQEPSRLPHRTAVEMLLRAARNGQSKVIRFIIDNQEPCQLSVAVAMHTHIPLYRDLRAATRYAATPADMQAIMALFPPDANLYQTYRDDDILSRLDRAARLNNFEMVRYFIEQGCELNNPHARRGAADEWVSPDGWQPERRRSRHRPLLSAVKSGNLKMVQLMLEHGADPNWFAEEHLPLIMAAYRGYGDIARALLEGGADVNDGNPPPVVVAIVREQTAMIELLMAHGAKLDTPETGPRAMGVAVALGLESMADLLVSKGVERGVVLHRTATRHERKWYLGKVHIPTASR